MHSLEGIVAMNDIAFRSAKRGARAESETSRHCSYQGDSLAGVVLHSAKQRATVFLTAGTRAKKFLAGWMGTNSAAAHDRLVESYF